MQLSLFADEDSRNVVSSNNWKNPLEYLKNREKPDPRSPIVVSFGGGTNSTAMLIAMVLKGIKPDLILFADTGGELPETYQWISVFSDWLQGQGFPSITVVEKGGKEATKVRQALLVKWEPVYKNLEWFLFSIYLGLLVNGNQFVGYSSLYEKCIALKSLPSRTFNRGECSITWKIEPQNNYVSQFYKDILGQVKIRKLIGYHSKEIHRLIKSKNNPFEDEFYRNEYPLIEWGLDQGNCISLIESIGLGVPPKSSCFFCPNRKRHEVATLKEKHPELYEAACFMEQNFEPREKGFVGLGRNWRWSDLDKLTPLEAALIEARQESRSCACVD